MAMRRPCPDLENGAEAPLTKPILWDAAKWTCALDAPQAAPNFAGVHESGYGVRREKAALSSGCKSHPATAPAGSSRSSYGGNEVAEAFG